MKVRFLAYAPGGALLGYLPYPMSWSASFVNNDLGALKLDYSTLAAGGEHLQRALTAGAEVAIEILIGSAWVEPYNGRYLLLKRKYDIADPSQKVEMTLPSWGWLAGKLANLDYNQLQPPDAPLNPGQRLFFGPDTMPQGWYPATPGAVAGDLWNEYVARGGAPMPLDLSTFTKYVDSAGATWSTARDTWVPFGATLLQVINSFTDENRADWRTQGRKLLMYNPDSQSVDRASTVFLRLKAELLDAPTEETLEDLAARVVMKGDQGAWGIANALTPDLPWGTWEAAASSGGVSDQAVLDSLADAQASARRTSKSQHTRTLSMVETGPLPLIDYFPGDWVSASVSLTSTQRMRVQQITLSDSNGSGNVEGNIVLNDRIYLSELRRAKELQALTSGAPSSNGVAPSPIPVNPSKVPLAPAGLTVQSQVVLNGEDKTYYARVVAVADPVTKDTAGADVTLDHYSLYARPTDVPGGEWRRVAAGPTNTLQWDPVVPGTSWEFRSRATSTTGHSGAWSPVISHDVETDGTPPPTPSEPTLDSGPKAIMVNWDGTFEGAAARPLDWAGVQVHMALSAGFVPGETTSMGAITSTRGGVLTVTGLDYDTTYYFKLVAYDEAGNLSEASSAASGQASHVGSTDLDAVINQAIQDASDDAEWARNAAAAAVTGTTVEYAVGPSETVAPTGGWSSDTPTRTPGSYIWMRSVITYGDTTTTTTSPVLVTGNQGEPGADGTTPTGITLTATTQILTSPEGGGATTPTTSVVTGIGAGTTITTWTYSVDGGAFLSGLPTGVTRSGNVVTITGQTMTARTIAVRAADGNGVSDTITVAKIGQAEAGTDAYTVLLTNEAHTFPGTPTTAMADSTTSTVLAYKGPSAATAMVGTITGQVTGLTTSITSNGTAAPIITVTVTTALVTRSGKLTIPITVDGVTFTKEMSWSVAYIGSDGKDAPTIALTATTQALSSQPTGGATTPATSVVTGTALNTTISAWTYSVDGGTFSATVPTGVTRSGNVVTITGATMTARTIAVRMADALGNADSLTVAKVFDGAAGEDGTDGADAYTVLLTNEAHTFPGGVSAALAGSVATNVLAYQKETAQAVTVGTITGQVSGLTTAVTNNGSTSPTITITVTTALTQQSGVLTIPVTVDGILFTKSFSWAVSYKGADGTPATPAKIISLNATTHVLSTPSTGGATTPTTSVVTGTATGTSISVWQYSNDGGAFSTTAPAWVSRSGNVVTITGATMTAKTTTVRMTDGGTASDTLTVAKVSDGSAGSPGSPGADAYTVLLTNESHTFAGSTSAALAGTATTNVLAYKGTVAQTVDVGTITGNPTGMTVAVTNDLTTNPQITITVTTALVQRSGVLTIPVTVAGVTYTKLFSWSVAYTGAAGYTPVKGTDYFDGEDGTDGTSSYLWVRYGTSSAGAGMTTDPTGMTHIGVATTATPAAPATAGGYQWSLIKGTDGIDGEPGDDGQTSYLHIKYSDNGTTFTANNGETPGAYIGTYVDFNPTDSLTFSAYTWNLVKGADGAPAKLVSLTATTQVLTQPATGGATNPATAVVTGAATNTTITVWQYSIDGAAFSATVPTGVSRTGNVVTITGQTMTAKTITVRMADASGVADTLTVAKVTDGADGTDGTDGYTVLLSNESHTFPGAEANALAGSITTTVKAFRGSVAQVVDVGTITGQVTGLTTSVTGDLTNAPAITVTVTTALTANKGVLTIPLVVDGVSFTKQFSWAVAYKGSPGPTGVGVSSVTSYFLQQAAGGATPATPTASPPPAPWTTTEPAYVAGTELWRTERIVYTNSTFAYTPPSKVSSYTAAVMAMTAANGKNVVIYGTADPTVTPPAGTRTTGDTYFRTASSKTISYYSWSGTAWVQQQFDPLIIPQIDIGTGTFGSLSGVRLAARSVTADKVLIAGSDNLFPDPQLTTAAVWSPTTYFSATGGRIAGGSILVPAGASQLGVYMAATGAYLVPVVPGATYTISAWVNTSAVAGAGTIRLYARSYNRSTLAISGATTPTFIANTVATVAGVWTRIVGQVKIPDSADAMTIGAYHESGYSTGTARFSNFSIVQAGTGELYVDGSIYAKVMETREFKADAIETGTLQAGVSITAGNPLGSHAELSSAGFKAYVETEDGPAEAVRLGTSESDVLALTDSSGNLMASISETGSASFDQVTTNGLTVGGETLEEILTAMPRGVLAYYSHAGSAPPAAGTTFQPLVELAFTLPSRRIARVQYQGAFYTDSTDLNARGYAIMRHTTDGSAPTPSSPGLADIMSYSNGQYIGATDMNMASLVGNFTSSPQTIRVLVAYRAWESGYSMFPGADFRIWAEDIGPGISQTGIYRATAPVTPPTQTYTSEWEATQGGTYRGDGSLRSDTTDMRQGYVGQQNGDQHGIALFTGGAVSGQTGVTVGTAMSGATIRKAEVYLYANHWYWNSGGTAIISTHGHTGMTSETPNTTKINSGGWPKPGGRWVDITSIWNTGKRGIWVGKTGTSNLEYYGWFNGPGAGSNKPRLRITYTK